MLSRTALGVRLTVVHSNVSVRQHIMSTLTSFARLQSSNSWLHQRPEDEAQPYKRRRTPRWNAALALGVATGSAAIVAWILNEQSSPPSLDNYALFLAETAYEAFVILSSTTKVAARRLAELDRDEAAHISDCDSDALSAGKDARAFEIIWSIQLVHDALLQQAFQKVRVATSTQQHHALCLFSVSLSDPQRTWCYRGSRGSG